MICNPNEAGIRGSLNVAVDGIHEELYETSQSSLVEWVCEFLERYATAHGDDAKNSAARSIDKRRLPKERVICSRPSGLSAVR
jgi:hypothetical protein